MMGCAGDNGAFGCSGPPKLNSGDPGKSCFEVIPKANVPSLFISGATFSSTASSSSLKNFSMIAIASWYTPSLGCSWRLSIFSTPSYSSRRNSYPAPMALPTCNTREIASRMTTRNLASDCDEVKTVVRASRPLLLLTSRCNCASVPVVQIFEMVQRASFLIAQAEFNA